MWSGFEKCTGDDNMFSTCAIIYTPKEAEECPLYRCWAHGTGQPGPRACLHLAQCEAGFGLQVRVLWGHRIVP